MAELDDIYQSLSDLGSQTFTDEEAKAAAMNAARAEAMAQCVGVGVKYPYKEFDVELIRWGYLPKTVEVLARVWQNGRQLGFGPDGMIDIERFRFNNIPMFVHNDEGYRYNFAPSEAVLEAITSAALSDGKDSGLIVPDTVGSTTYTLFPPSGGSGQIVSQATTVYATMRAGNSLAAVTSVVFTGQDKSGTLYDGSEGFLAFDTSVVAGTITAATLSMYTNDTSQVGLTWTMNARDIASPLTSAWIDIPTISTSDWIAGGSVSAQTLMASVSVTTSTTQGAYLTFTSQAAFNDGTHINQSGLTGLMLTSSRFEAGSTPTAGESLGMDSDGTNTVAGTGSDPKLVIVATAPTTNGNFLMLMR